MTLREKMFAIQNEVGKLVKTQDNPFFKSKYFDVNQVISTLKPLLEKNKVLVIQPLAESNGKNVLKTMVLDTESIESFEYHCMLPEGLDAQKSGSAITYFRRYALQSLFLLEAQDDDANIASGSYKPVTKYKSTVTKEQQADFNAKVKANPTYRMPTIKVDEGEADPNDIPDFSQ